MLHNTEHIFKRLEIIKNYLVLEDFEEVKSTTKKLIDYNDDARISNIKKLILNDQFVRAFKEIENYISTFQQISHLYDPEIGAIKYEIKKQQHKLEIFENEKIEIEKQLFYFQHKFTKELGGLILEILKLKNDQQLNSKPMNIIADENENYEYYNYHLEAEKHKLINDLSEEELKEAKRIFRKASLLCHPDIANNQREDSQTIFINLKNAYETNNLAELKSILYQLENKSETLSSLSILNKKEELMKILENLKEKNVSLGNEIFELRNSKEYIKYTSIKNFDEYIKNKKAILANELQLLKDKQLTIL